MRLKKFEDNDMQYWDIVRNQHVFQFKSKNSYFYKILILIFLFIITTTFIYFMNFKNNKNTIFNKYYANESYNVKRSGIDNFNAIIKIQERDFDSASHYFKLVLEIDSSNITARYYLGLCYLEMGEYNKSIDEFNLIIENNNNLYVEKSIWHAALCYIQIGDRQNAIKNLNLLLNKNNIYYEKSKEILNDL